MDSMIKWLESKRIKESLGHPGPGCFALEPTPDSPDPSISWERCRERFSNVFLQDTKGFFFSHEEGEGDNIAAFIDKTEQIVDAQNSSFGKTNRFYAIWVEPSEFWLACGIRRSLFTILLRAARSYKQEKDNYEEALFNQEYVRDTKDAVKRFLYGFTKFVNGDGWSNCRGWVTQFKNQPIDQICRHLVSSEPLQLPMIGMGSLWR